MRFIGILSHYTSIIGIMNKETNARMGVDYSKYRSGGEIAEHSLVLRSPYCLDYGFYTNRSLFL